MIPVVKKLQNEQFQLIEDRDGRKLECVFTVHEAGYIGPAVGNVLPEIAWPNLFERVKLGKNTRVRLTLDGHLTVLKKSRHF